MGYVIGLDLGTTYTAAAVARDHERPDVVQLGTRSAAIPSVVFLQDAGVLTGDAALRRGLAEPERLAREFKRRVGDPAPILLGGVPLSAETLFARLLRWTVDLVTEREGAAPDHVAVCHPANWGPYKLELLAQACRMAELEAVTTITEPEAAAIQYAALERLETGALVAVYDLGGGTFDAAVLRKTEAGFEIVGRPEGIERLGGIDFDEAIVAHVRAAIAGSLPQLDDDPGTVVALARLRQECVEAKEALSADVETSIPVVLPGLQTEVRLTRAEFESMIRVPLLETIAALRRALRDASVEPEELTAVLLVGGSSRIPIVAEIVGSELHRPVAVDADPKYVVALGAARAATEHLRVADRSPAPAAAPQAPAAPRDEAVPHAATHPASAGAAAAGTDDAITGSQADAGTGTAPSAAPIDRPLAPPPSSEPPPRIEPPREPTPGRARRRWLPAAIGVLLVAVTAAVVAILVLSGGNADAGAEGTPATTEVVAPGTTSSEVPSEAPGIELEWTRLQDAGLTGTGRQELIRVAPAPDGTVVAVGSESVAGGRDAAFWTLRDLEGTPSVEKDVVAEAGDQAPFGVTWDGVDGLVAVGYRQPDPVSPDLDAAVWRSSGEQWELGPGDFGDPPYQVMNRVATGPNGDLLAVGAVGEGVNTSGAPLQTDGAAWLSSDGGASFDRLETATVPKDAYQVMRAAAAYGGGWVVVGEDGPNAAVWRLENEAWRQIEDAPDLVAGGQRGELDARDVHAWLDALVAVGFVTSTGGDRDAGVWVSADGETWELLANESFGGPGDQEALGVVAGEFGIVAVGCSRCDEADAQPMIWTSMDGVTWSHAAGDGLPGAGRVSQLTSVARAGATLVAVGWERADADRDATVWLARLPTAP